MRNKTLRYLFICSFAFLICTVYPQNISYAQPGLQEQKSDNCATNECHADFGKETFVHGPVSAGKCIVCHGELPKHLERPKWNKYGKVKDIAKACFSCHEPFEQKKYTHRALTENTCIACHDPHGSPNKFQLLAKGGELCFQCHDRALTKNQYVHGPAAVGGCSICHDPHTSDYKNNLIAEGSTLCFLCHTEKGEDFQAAEFKHKPVAESCTNCHNPHSAPKKYMMTEDAPQLCFNCHLDKKKYLDEVPVKHGALTAEGTCMNCHDPHMSNIAKNLLMPPMDLCLNCHDKEVEAPDGRKLTDMKRLLAENIDHHGPIKQKDCSGCHNPHGSDNFRILRNPYPAKFYKPFRTEDYNLCFSCHEKTVVQNPKTTKLTNFRNGDINLHFKHVNKPDKGRTCRACHETHASNAPKHIRDTIPFGMWDLPLNFEKTETGGSCLPGCHQLKQYDREVMVHNP